MTNSLQHVNASLLATFVSGITRSQNKIISFTFIINFRIVHVWSFIHQPIIGDPIVDEIIMQTNTCRHHFHCSFHWFFARNNVAHFFQPQKAKLKDSNCVLCFYLSTGQFGIEVFYAYHQLGTRRVLEIRSHNIGWHKSRVSHDVLEFIQILTQVNENIRLPPDILSSLNSIFFCHPLVQKKTVCRFQK